ncbi:DEAD/DEAH box helicase [Okeania sp. KiyG1]|uniref:DEAD/DEAH box helicase n=1 Tax=Okeania sp. KiyG1 TaxID=2720165 RepID=UPI001920688B|nr:DEAD/DEAH box helicase [Okeania sp. KiyG1]GGA17620.1 putative ATP-dependent helicase YprA [Okeania sp. KiyG1]
MTDKPTDYAAILRATENQLPLPPEWLKIGVKIYSSEHGIGQITAVLGKRLIVDFIENPTPVHFPDWQIAINQKKINPRDNVIPQNKNLKQPEKSKITSAEIAAIPRPVFQTIAEEFKDNLVGIDNTPPTPGKLYPLPEDLPITLKSSLILQNITELYEHQIESLNALRKELDLCIFTPTASGKTLCYNLAILESCLQQPQTTALYIFPLKALALDQMQKLEKMVSYFPENSVKIGLITGDISSKQRKKLFIPNPPNILGVSPDLLHYQLYRIRSKDGEGWRKFFQQLRYVVIDESHTYRGAFGAHFSNLMRRLKMAVDRVGGNSEKLQFIFSSATIGNPAEMAMRFSDRSHEPERLHLISKSGADSAGRTILCFKPSHTANPDACQIILSWLRHDLSGIVFCNSRGAVKKLLGIIKRIADKNGESYLADKVAIFYGSLQLKRRQDIIQKLEAGIIKVILSTSALEAGIDLPGLDCCLVRGYPGSLMSWGQRIGRAGRRNAGLVMFLPVAQNPLDNFYGNQPNLLLNGEVESAAFNPNYPTILGKHLECSCVESGVPLNEITERFGEVSGVIADSLLKQEKIYITNSSELWGYGFPHRNINIRGHAQNDVELINIDTGKSFEKMQMSLAHKEVFPGAIYFAQNYDSELNFYRSENLDLDKKQAILKPLGKDCNLESKPRTQLVIQEIQQLAKPQIIQTNIPHARLRLSLIWGEITSLVTGYDLFTTEYTKKGEIVRINLDKGSFTPPYQTQYQAPVVKVEINHVFNNVIEENIRQIQEKIKQKYQDTIPDKFKKLWSCSSDFIALHSMGHQLMFAVPLVVLSSSQDVQWFVKQEAGEIVGYFFDTCDGGNGASEAIFNQLLKFARKATELAKNCDCEHGCPRCLTQHNCPQQNQGLYKDLGLLILEAIAF